MKKIVFDSSALIALFTKGIGYELVRDLLVKMANEESEGYISAISIGEIYYLISNKSNIKKADQAIVGIKQLPVQIIEPDLKMCLDAAAIKSKYSLSYTDSFAAALTMVKKAVLISWNHEFESLSAEQNLKLRILQ